MSTRFLLVLSLLIGCGDGNKAPDSEDTAHEESPSDSPTDSDSAEDTNAPEDADGDGYPAEEDCDDNDASVHPEAEESCNGVDDNCDGQVDEGVMSTWYVDADNDGFGDAEYSIESCEQPGGMVADGTDCNDDDRTVYPGAETVCNDGQINDCDGTLDDELAFCRLTGEYDLTDVMELQCGSSVGALEWQETLAVAVSPTGEVAVGDHGHNVTSFEGAVLYCDGTQELLISGASGDDRFGSGVTFVANHVLIGAPSSHLDAGPQSGNVFHIDTSRVATGVVTDLPHTRWHGTVGNAVGSTLVGHDGALFVGAQQLTNGTGAGFAVQLPGTQLTNASMTTVASPIVTGANENEYAGQTGVAGCDLSDDGVPEIVLSLSPTSFYGTPNYAPGVVAIGETSGSYDAATNTLWGGEHAGAEAGSSVDCGDVDGDGIDDLFIGAPGTDGIGAGYIVYGPIASGVVRDLSVADLRISGGASSDAFCTHGLLHDLDGDGKEDLVCIDPRESGDGTIRVLYGPVTATSADDSDLTITTNVNAWRLGKVSAETSSRGSESSLLVVAAEGYGGALIPLPGV